VFTLIYIEAMYDQLKRLGLREKENHPVFGDWERILEQKFTKEMYLDRKKSDRMNANGRLSYDYRIGPRAMVEIDKKDILQFISLVSFCNATVTIIDVRRRNCRSSITEAVGIRKRTN
jgi:hypothetical protein